MSKYPLFLLSILSLLFLGLSPAQAEEVINIHLRIEGPESAVLNTDLILPDECQVFDTTTTTPHTFAGTRAICALEQAKIKGLIASYQVTDWGFGFSLDSINEIANAPDWSQTWVIRVNNQAAATGIDGVGLQNNDELLLTYGPWPMEPLEIIQPTTTTSVVGETISLVAQVWNDNTGQFEPFTSTTTFWANNESSVSASGTLNWLPQITGTYQIWAEAEAKTRSAPFTLTTTSSTPENLTSVDLNLRYQDQFIFSDAVNLSSSTIFSYTDTSDNSTASTSTGLNVLAALLTADATSTAFAISDLQYYPAFNSFYLNCLDITSPTSTTACANWNYVVNGIYPSFGMDSYPLSGGETIYIYFSNPWQITASTSTFPVNTTTTLATWRYNYNSTSTEWVENGGEVIDISVPNPAPTGWWDATMTTTTLTTNASGTVEYVFSATGTYYAKITSPDYSKWSPAITLTVLDAPATSTPENGGNNGGEGGNGGVGSGTPTVAAAVIAEKAQAILNFLQSQQTEDGKIIDGGITDWAIISFAANNQYAEEIKKGGKSLLEFAQNYNFTDASELNLCASYPRHLLALLSAGIATSESAIQSLNNKIKSAECYKDNQYGQNGINDDVFALIALFSADTPVSEPIITDIISTITKDQTAEGAFTWAGFASPDITGASLNALRYAQNKGAILDQNIFTKAKAYLKTQQLNDGGWGFGQADALTTSWAMMGINALGEGQIEWTNSAAKNPWTVLTAQLNDQGYYEPSWAPGTIDWFGTKHAVPALLGKTWPLILAPKPSPPAINNSIGSVGGVAAILTVASSTLPALTTSTLPTETPTATSTFAIPETTEAINLPNPSQNEPASLSSSRLEISPSRPAVPSGKTVSRTTATSLAQSANSPDLQLQPPTSPLPLPETSMSPNSLSTEQIKTPPPETHLPLKKKVATTTVAGSAILLSATSLFLLFRLLLTLL